MLWKGSSWQLIENRQKEQKGVVRGSCNDPGGRGEDGTQSSSGEEMRECKGDAQVNWEHSCHCLWCSQIRVERQEIFGSIAVVLKFLFRSRI